MQIHDHVPNAWGSAFLWGGIVLGALLVAAFLTRGFGLLGADTTAASAPAMLVRQGEPDPAGCVRARSLQERRAGAGRGEARGAVL